MFYDCYTALCQARGISRSRAAQEMGLSNSTVTKWKNTGATPSGETLARVSAYFGVPVGELLGEAVPSVQEERKLPEGAVPFDPALTAPLLDIDSYFSAALLTGGFLLLYMCFWVISQLFILFDIINASH